MEVGERFALVSFHNIVSYIDSKLRPNWPVDISLYYFSKLFCRGRHVLIKGLWGLQLHVVLLQPSSIDGVWEWDGGEEMGM